MVEAAVKERLVRRHGESSHVSSRTQSEMRNYSRHRSRSMEKRERTSTSRDDGESKAKRHKHSHSDRPSTRSDRSTSHAERTTSHAERSTSHAERPRSQGRRNPEASDRRQSQSKTSSQARKSTESNVTLAETVVTVDHVEAAPVMTAEEKRQQRLDKVRKLMDLKKSQGLLSKEIEPSKPLPLKPLQLGRQQPSSLSEVLPTPQTAAAFDSSAAEASILEEGNEILVEEVVAPHDGAQAEVTVAVDTLDAYMASISTEVDDLAEADRNRKPRRRKKKGAVPQAPVATPLSISFDEVLALQQQSSISDLTSTLSSLPAAKRANRDSGESPTPLNDLEEVRESDMMGQQQQQRVENIENNITGSSIDIDGILPSPSSLFNSSAVLDDTIPAAAATITANDSDMVDGSTIPSLEEATAVMDSYLEKGEKVKEDEEEDSYYQQFITQMKKQQQLALEEEERKQKLKELAAAEAKQQALNKEAQREREEAIDIIPGSVDIGVDDQDIMIEEEEDYRFEISDGNDQPTYFDLVEKVGNKKELPVADHARITYTPFRKNLYIQVREITLMKDHEVDALRKLHGGIRVRGKACPRPIRTFYQCGLPDVILKVIEKREYEDPFPIQMQAIPALMAGRDVIGIAETGSGKTLAYLLPLLRHILDQPPLRNGEGPVGLILAPTRELACQIQKETNKLAKIVNLRSVAIYGGTGIGEQLGALKRGAEMIVATPGRLIDVLTINGGKVTNLRRVTFCVLDEADRMFDLGFGPQIASIIDNIRPDRQTALFSATFPPHVEGLARQILRKPVEITVGEKGQTGAQIEQYVEVWSCHREKFLRLLQLLGEWTEHGSIIIFVSKQSEADDLFMELLKMGYPALTLHGGQDQTDRDFTIQDFKAGVKNILIATSVAARGLDVKSVVLVINFVAPDHLEDYVHRIGRTGRAGNIGVAYTFITPPESEKAEDLIKALKKSGRTAPPGLQHLADHFRLQCNIGLVKMRKGKGFGGKGFKFTATEKSRQQQERQRMKKDLGLEDSDQEEETPLDPDELDNPMAPLPPPPLVPGGVPGLTTADTSSSTTAAAIELGTRSIDPVAAAALALSAGKPVVVDDKAKAVEALRASLKQRLGPPSSMVAATATQTANANVLTQLAMTAGSVIPGTAMGTIPGLSPAAYIDPATGNAVDEFDINDYPQYARFKITHKDVLHRLADVCGAVMQVKGRYVPHEEKDSPLTTGVKRLYVEIIGSTAVVVQRAKHEIRSLLEQVAIKQLNTSSNTRPIGRYSVV